MIREASYDEVFDSQRHFRSILDSMARPGKINQMKDLEFDPPVGLMRSTAAVCLSLLNHDVSFYLSRGNQTEEEFLKINTGSRPSSMEEADFLIVDEAESPDMVRFVKEGLLTYPEQGATFIIQTRGVSEERIEGYLGIHMEGPGINGDKDLYVSGLKADWIDVLKEKNSEFPLGVDVILVNDAPEGRLNIACIPRSARISEVA